MNKKTIIGISGVAAAVCLVGGLLYSGTRFDLKINGQKIDDEEYLYVMNRQIYDITQQMAGSDVQVNNEFWTTEKDGELPYEKLADQTVEQLKHNRAVYECAKEHGYVDAIDYKHILERMNAENKSRAEKIKAGEAVYGLSEFKTELFMEYEMDTFQKLYCENLENEGMEISEEEREQYYEENKDTLFVKQDDVVLDYIKIPYETEGLREEQVGALKNELTEVYKNLDEENSLKSLAEERSDLKKYLMHEEILSGEFFVKAKSIGEIIDYSYELQKGEATQVIDEYGTLYLIQCTDRVDYDYQPIDQVKENINKELRERHYNQLIEERAEKSKVDGSMKHVYAFTKRHIKK